MEKSIDELKQIREDYHKARKLSSLDYQKLELKKDKMSKSYKEAKNQKKQADAKNNEQMDLIE